MEDKMTKLTRRLMKWMNGGRAAPVAIELIPTNRCNSRCLTCWRQGQELDYSDEMTDERLFRLIDEAGDLGVGEIAFVGGGEPTARPITLKLCDRIKGYGMFGDLVTNGTILEEKDIAHLVDIQWDMMKVSLDGADAAMHDHLRGVPGTFDRVNRMFDNFRDYKTRTGSRLPRMVVNVVISNVNNHQFYDIVRHAASKGVEEILLLPMTVFSDTGAKLKMEDDEIAVFQDQIVRAMEFIKDHGVMSNMHEFLDKRYVEKTNTMDEVIKEEADKKLAADGEADGEGEGKADGEVDGSEIERREREILTAKADPYENFLYIPCFDPWHHVTIIANGNIGPCFNAHVWKTKTTIKDHSLEELWYGEYFERFRRQLLNRRLSDDCKTCCVWKVFEMRTIRERLEQAVNKEKSVLRKWVTPVVDRIVERLS